MMKMIVSGMILAALAMPSFAAYRSDDFGGRKQLAGPAVSPDQTAAPATPSAAQRVAENEAKIKRAYTLMQSLAGLIGQLNKKESVKYTVKWDNGSLTKVWKKSDLSYLRKLKNDWNAAYSQAIGLRGKIK